MSWPGGRVEGETLRRGTSGLHRAGRWVTPTRGDPRDSATENRPPSDSGPAARVKRWGKSPPAHRVTGTARQTPPGARPDRERSRAARPSSRVGRWRRAATYVVDGWPSPARGQPRAGTEPGVSASSSAPRTSRPGTVDGRSFEHVGERLGEL